MGNPLKRKKELRIKLAQEARSAGVQQEEVAPQPEPVVVEESPVETAAVEEAASEPQQSEAASQPEGEVRTSKYKRKVQ